MKRKHFRPLPKPAAVSYDYNDRIRVSEMVVIDNEGNNLGVLSKDEALRIARERELDLVLVSPKGDKPVARIVDWAKFKYEKSKKARKAKSKTVENKEWWFKPNIEDRDLSIKLEKVKTFLIKGGTAKLTVRFVGRKNIQREQIEATMKKLLELSTEFAKPTSEILREGRNLSILVKNK